MCGIFACYPDNESWLERSVSVHSNRDPDQTHTFSFNDFGISINRLAVTGDLENGFQPVAYSSGNTLCVFNGTIFNTGKLLKNFLWNPFQKMTLRWF